MSEWLRFSVAFWHTIRGDGSDPFGAPTKAAGRPRAAPALQLLLLALFAHRVPVCTRTHSLHPPP